MKNKQTTAIVLSNPISLMTVKQMKDQLELETSKRELIVDFIKRHFVEGTDYGVIKIVSKRTGKEYESKPTLFKPGAEKFCSMFRIRAEYSKDAETWEMLGNKENIIALKCNLYNGDILVGEGRGVCTVSEKSSENTAVKIAKKRAKLDAVLETGGLSDFFTQDLDDEETRDAIQGKKTKVKDLYAEANKMIETSSSIGNLLTIAERIEKSDKFTEEQKKILSKKCSDKVDVLDQQNEKKGKK